MHTGTKIGCETSADGQGGEPEISARTNSSDGIRSMIAADLGIFLGPEVNYRHQMELIDFYPLREGEGGDTPHLSKKHFLR
jgi:DNA-binding transcriptional LysR family regulator